MARRQKSTKQEQTATQPVAVTPIVTRAEWLTLIGIVLLAVALRFAYPSRMAIEHFDEGVYASNIFFSEAEGGQYPYRHLYAPPLLPFLIEWGIIFLGPESIAPFLPALILGTATVPLAWWAVRNWFGPLAGLAAAWLIATSDFHILYSRTALTDVPVAFFILLAVYLYWEAVRRESLRWSIAAGVATGLAWWTKYTGWLPLAIALAGSIPWVITDRRAAGVSLPSRAKKVAACFATMAVVASVVWSPVLWHLQPYGGYAAVAQNHEMYLKPLGAWPHNTWEQAGNIAAQSGVTSIASLAVFAAAVMLASPLGTPVRAILALWAAVTIGWATWQVGPAGPLALLAIGAITLSLIPPRWTSAAPEVARPESSQQLALWLVVAFYCGLLLSTPFYQPYPRLSLPWLIAAFLGTAAWPSRTGERFFIGARSFLKSYAFAACLLAIPILVFVARLHSSPWYTAKSTTPAWQDRRSVKRAAVWFSKVLREQPNDGGDATAAFVYREPGLFFHLASLMESDEVPVVVIGNLKIMASPPSNVAVYLAMQPPRASELPAQAMDREWQLLHRRAAWEFSVPYTSVSSVVTLDDGRPRRTSPNWGSSQAQRMKTWVLERVLP